MKSIILNGAGNCNVRESQPDPDLDQIALLKVLSSGICAADKYLWSGNHPWSIDYPIVPGHEIFGEIVEIDEDLSATFPIGTKVAVQVIVPCYDCPSCSQGFFNMCEKKRHFGSYYKGAFSNFVQIPRGARMHKYLEPIDDLIGGLSESMANAIYCTKRSGLLSSDHVLILGMGSIGACLAMYLKLEFPKVAVSVLTNNSAKESILSDFSITSLALSDLNGYRNHFNQVFEMSGYAPYLEFGLSAIASRGTLLQYGVFTEAVTVDLNQVSEFKELTIVGAHLADDESFDLSLEFLSKNQKELKFLISNIVGYEDYSSVFSSEKFAMFKSIFQPRIKGDNP